MTHTDPMALLSDVERPPDQADPPRPGRLRPRVAGIVELLWHERDARQRGCLTTITIPLAGATPPPEYGFELASVLADRWTGRLDLTPGVRILSVTARVDRPALGSPSLVVSLVTDDALDLGRLAERRIASELRRAVRDLRRGYALPAPIAA